MRSFIASLAFAAAVSTASAKSPVFETPNPTWAKVQDGSMTSVTQWSVFPAMSRSTRFDLMSQVEGDVRKTFYVIRQACANGAVEWRAVGIGNVMGFGKDCDGNVAYGSVLPLALSLVEPLPADAKALITQPKK